MKKRNIEINMKHHENKKTSQEETKEKQEKKELKQQEPDKTQEKEKEAIEETRDNRAEELEKELSELKDKYLRLAAEYDNFRRRTAQEKSDLLLHGAEKTILDLLPILDDLDLAKKNISEASDIEALSQGINLIMTKFSEFLTKQGVSAMEVINLPFDADTQQAVALLPTDDEKQKGCVIDCIKKGYKLHDKVIRIADVIVGQ